MTKRNEQVAARRVDALARSEANICERLLGMRSELDMLMRLIDRATMARHPRMLLADGLSAGHGGLPRGIADLITFRQRRGRT